MALIELNIFQRENTGKNANRRTRAGGRIPAVLYGSKRETSNIEVDTLDFTKALIAAGGSSVIFALKQEATDEDAIALLRDVQRNPVNDIILHLDLFEIPRGVPITTPVRIEVEGESLDIKRGDAIMSTIVDSVEVSCLPRELPEAVRVDISDLVLGDKVYVKDLEISAGTITSDPDTLILLLKAPTVFTEPTEEIDEEGVEGEEGAEDEAEGTEPTGDKEEGGGEGKDKDTKS